MSFPAHPSYQDSGVEWLGEVPIEWAVFPGRRVFRQTREPSLETDEQLSASQKYGVVPQSLLMRLEDQKVVLALKGTGGFKHVDEDDFVISLRSFQGGIEHSRYTGCVSPAYTVLKPSKLIVSRYYFYILKTRSYIGALQSVTDGIRDGKNISYDQFGLVALPVPPLEDQAAIAAFLDRETDKIDALIEEQRRLIALLKEKRQAVISHAVTKGLNTHAPMRDSGIEWLGEVPAHWEVKPLKYLVSLRSGGTPSKSRTDYWEGSIPWASAKDLKSERLSDTIDHLTDAAIIEGGVELNPSGSILILVRGMMLARAFPVVEITVPMAINQDLKAILPKNGMSSQFLAWAFRGTAQESLDRCSEAGHGTKALRMEDWLTMPLPCPPQDEQCTIAAVLDERTKQFDQLVENAEGATELLVERRAALISAAVTGKIDVRKSAKVLPFLVSRARARGLVATEIIERLAQQPTFGRVKFQKIAFLVEGHVGVQELAGCYTREAAGPLDRALIAEMESEAHSIAGVEVDQADGTGTAVSYRLCQQRGAHRKELADWLGADRIAKLDKLIANFADLSTKGAEAVATLYGVWNDALIEGASPTDDEIISGFLHDWHPEKREKFRADELPIWLDWMHRHGIEPTGTGPKTTTGRLFA